ncbi:MAG: carbamate kinase [Planctomycetota bacterium]
METIVIALGGNAIIKAKEFTSVYDQFARTRQAMDNLVEIFKRGYNFVLTHGNGPQVGNILIRVEASGDKAYPIPLGVAVAQTQGEMGYMIAQVLSNEFVREGIRRDIVCVLTQVLVDPNEDSVQNPTKFVGPVYEDQHQVDRLLERGVRLKMDQGRGMRRVVPSPTPLSIIERDSILRLLQSGVIVVACGGGGMPVYHESDGTLEGIDGVIDKDLASAVLAREITAHKLVIVTGVKKVASGWGTPQQVDHDILSLSQAKRLLDDGEFPPGNMGPKIQAAIEFLEHGGRKVLITDIEDIVPAFEGRAGTLIVPDHTPF